MILRAVFLMAGVLLIASSCGSSNDTTNDMEATFETITRGTMGGFISDDEQGEKLIRSNDEFRDIWRKMNNSVQQGDAEMPEIDFERYMVVAVMMGEMPSSGYSIRVTDIEEREEDILLSVLRTEPGPTCMNLTVITTPHHMVKIPRFEKEIRFDYSTRIEECD